MGNVPPRSGPPRRASRLLHCLITRVAIQYRDKDPACLVQMVGSTARGCRFRAFRTKLLAVGGTLGRRIHGVSMDGFEEPITFPERRP